MLKSICTVGNIKIYDELLIMIKSFSLFNEADIFVAGDKEVVKKLNNVNLNNKIHALPLITDKHNNARQDTGKNWLPLMMLKMDVMEEALDKCGNVMFIDADMIFFSKMSDIDFKNYEVMLCRHMIRKKDENNFGRYNGGYVGTNRLDFPQWWRNKTKTSTFYEQKCLELAPKDYKVKELPIRHNFGWWRIDQAPSNDEKRKRLNSFSVQGNHILYNGAPLVSIHTHIKKSVPAYKSSNTITKRLLNESSNPKHKKILSWI